MNSSPTLKIKRLISSLPKKDIELAYKFLDERDFESLQELINSDLYKIEKNLDSDNPKEEYLNISLDNLEELKVEVDDYIILINGTSDDYETELNYY